jgi:hypothetical protein
LDVRTKWSRRMCALSFTQAYQNRKFGLATPKSVK